MRQSMNKYEYSISEKQRSSVFYKLTHQKLKQWKVDNNINERCIVHHRDDTEETRKYNEEHYELWGCNEDGTFEYGKYVIFMTVKDHVIHHHTGSIRSDEARQRMSESRKGRQSTFKGKSHTESAKIKQSQSHLGKTHSEETRRKMSQSNIGKHSHSPSEETRLKMSNAHKGKQYSTEYKQKSSARVQQVKEAYLTYQSNGGSMKWQEFQHAIKIGEILI